MATAPAIQTSIEQLESHLQALDAQAATLRRKHETANTKLQRASSERLVAVAELVSAPEARAVQIHRSIDALDVTIREETRTIEGLALAIDAAGDEVARIHSELSAAREKEQREQDARETEESATALVKLREDCLAKFDAATEALARFNTAAYWHAERGPLAANFSDSQLELFVKGHRARIGTRNWQPAGAGRTPDLAVEVRPTLPPKS